jgi:hypothetical protein
MGNIPNPAPRPAALKVKEGGNLKAKRAMTIATSKAHRAANQAGLRRTPSKKRRVTMGKEETAAENARPRPKRV